MWSPKSDYDEEKKMFEKLKNKFVKVVWKDLNANGQNKAVYGELSEFSPDFICVIQNDKPIYLSISSIVTIKEYEKKESDSP